MSTPSKPRPLVFLSVALLATVPGCTAKRINTDVTVATPSTELSRYKQATTLAQNPTPDKIYTGLVRILPENSELSWKEIDGQDYVLMTTYTSSFAYYEDSVGKMYNTGAYDIWVTAAPFVQELCGDPDWVGADLELRLEQVLGLPPNAGKVGFAAFWVRPEDLFRPCPDNEITDDRCDLNFPADTEDWYRSWFNNLRAGQYVFCPPNMGYPWTQLGYTFDWKDLDRPVGLSEFVIRQEADVFVEALIPTDVYCSPQ